MGKNVVIFSDGTGQWGGLKPDQELSNIYKLYRASRNGPDSPINPAEQIAVYHPGLGSGEADSWWQWAQKMWSSITGTGFTQNVAECYEAILRHYEPGDRVFLFGFSRGAYTVRSVAGVMNLCGVPTRIADGTPDGTPIPRFGSACRTIAREAVHGVYEHGAGHKRGRYEAEREEKARRFREKYGSDGSDPARGNVAPYFIGVFDTVAALGMSDVQGAIYTTLLCVGGLATVFLLLWIAGLAGLNAEAVLAVLATAGVLAFGLHAYRHRIKTIWNFPDKGNFRLHWSAWKFQHYDMHLDPRVRYARHALAIDEDRETFARVGWASRTDVPKRAKGEPPWLIQMWFSGNHSDIGGSYPEDESRLSDIALEWMVGEATEAEHPLIVDRTKLNLFPDPHGMQHCEVEAFLDRYPGWWPNRRRWGWKKELRWFDEEMKQHSSVGTRMKADAVRKYGRRIKYDPLGERQAGQKPEPPAPAK
jgi:hypothetical protein